jgi:hypothetical protein
MLYREIIAVCSEIHTEHTNSLCGQNVYLKIQSVPRSKHTPSRLWKSISRCFMGKKCYELDTEHINISRRLEVEFFNIKPCYT